MAVCGSTRPDLGFAEVSLVRLGTCQLTIMAGVKAHIAIQNAIKGLNVICGVDFFCFQSESICHSITSTNSSNCHSHII